MTTDRELRDSWRRVRFGDVVRELKIATKDPESDGLTRVVGLEHLDSESLPLRRWNELSDLGDGTSFTRVFRAGQVLFGKRRAYQRKVAVADFDGICSSDILVFEPSTDELLREFLPYLVQSDGFFDHALGTSAGSLSPRTKFQELAKYEFALPPVDEQRRATEVLVAIDAVAAAYADAATETRRVVQALVTEAARTGTVTSLGELASNGGIQIGPFGSQLHAHEYTDEGVPVVMPSDMTADGFKLDSIRRVAESTAERLRSHRVRPGDILLPRRGDLNKRVLITENEAGWLCGTGSVRVRLDDPVDSPLVERLLAGADTVRWLEANAVGTTMPNLNGDIVSRIPLPLPAANDRHAYANRLRGLRSVGTAAATAATSATSARRAILNAMLQGAYR